MISDRLNRSKGKVVALTAAVVLFAVACNPGGTTTLVGTGAAGNTGDGGPATAATMQQPGGLVVLPGGGFAVVDAAACVIRKVAADGTISTIAGNGTCGFSGDGGPATAAQINPIHPWFPAPTGQLAIDADGNLYLTDTGNNRVRRIDPAGTITTIAGDGSGDYTSNCNDIRAFGSGIAVLSDGRVVIACGFGIGIVQPDHTLQQIFFRGGYIGIAALASDGAGNLYFADTNGVVYRRTTAGAVSTYADVSTILWNLERGTKDDLAGREVTGLAVAADGTVYAGLGPISEIGYGYGPTMKSANRIMRLGQDTGTIIAGNGDADPGTGIQTGYAAQFAVSPMGIAVAPNGTLLFSSGHNVYRIEDAKHAASWNGTTCTPNAAHPGSDLSGLDFSGFDMRNCDLTGTNLTGTNLTGTNLTGSYGTGIIGTPSALPTGWQVVSGGILIGPGSNLWKTTLSYLDLTGADFRNATITSALFFGSDLTNADFTGAFGLAHGNPATIYSNTTCPDATVVTSPDTCVGHGFGA